MSEPKTLLQMAGAPAAPPSLADAAVVMIDCQREYVDGGLPLAGIDAALDEGARLLERARSAGSEIVHIQHKSPSGAALFDPDGPYFAIADPVAPAAGEAVVTKPLPNAFAKTELHDVLRRAGKSELVVAGFMTHLCVSSTVRAALDLGYRCTVVGGATATRDLPDGNGGVLDAASLKHAILVGLSDRFAVVVDDAAALSG